MRDKRKTRTKDLARRHQSGAQECAACCALARQGQISLTSKIRTLDHLLEQAKLAAFMERAGVRHPVELRSFQPHVAPALNQSLDACIGISSVRPALSSERCSSPPMTTRRNPARSYSDHIFSVRARPIAGIIVKPP